jgi:hypothetical protein
MGNEINRNSAHIQTNNQQNDNPEQNRRNEDNEDPGQNDPPPNPPTDPQPPNPPPPNDRRNDDNTPRRNRQSWDESLKTLRVCEKPRGPSGGIEIPNKQFLEWVSRLADIMVRIQRSNGANVSTDCKAMKDEFDSWTGGQFTYLDKNAKRGHIDETLSNRIEMINHLPHPFHCQCHIRGCTFGTEKPQRIENTFKTNAWI